MTTNSVRYESFPRKLPNWFSAIRQNHLVLPRFQRMEAWDHSQVRELLESVIDGLPVGSALLLAVSGDPQFAWRRLSGAPNSGADQLHEMVLDGQQRLTALWRALNDDYINDPDPYKWCKFFLRIRDNNAGSVDELPLVERFRFHRRNDNWYPLWASSPKEVLQRGLIPISLLNPSPEFSNRITPWIREAVVGTEDDPMGLHDIISSFRERIILYELPFIRLTSSTPLEAIVHTFTKVNTQGTPLSPFDLAVARMELHEIDLHEEVQELREHASALAYFSGIEDLDFLRALVLLSGQVPTLERIITLDASKFRRWWPQLKKGVIRGLSFIHAEGIPDGERLPTEAILPALFALWSEVPEGGIDEGNARTLLRQYLWRAFFSDRYERGVNTAVFQDYQALRERIRGRVVQIPIMQAPLPSEPSELLEAGWPTRRERLARAILCVTLRAGAKDVHDDSQVSAENARNREYHHLFPRNFLKERDMQENPDMALNCALITWKSNRQISDKSPRKYLEEAANKVLDEQELDHRFRSHLIPIEPFINEDYQEFLKKRAALVFEDMKSLTAVNDLN